MSRPSTPPVFLVGPARSGTSLLYKALCLHPDVAYLSNYLRRAPDRPKLAVLNRLARRSPGLRQSVWFGSDSNAYVYGSRRSRLHRMFPQPVEGEPVFAHCGLPEFGWQAAGSAGSQQQALRQTVRSVCCWAGAPTFVNKRIANNRRIPELVAALPDARFVCIVRDGRAVAYSLSRVDWWEDSVVWWYGDTPRRWREEGNDPWELCARNWVEEVREIETGLRSVPAAQVLSISYERFVAAPLETLREVGAFAGLSATPSWLGDLGRLRFPDRNDAWQHQLEPEVAERIQAAQHDTLLRYDYAV